MLHCSHLNERLEFGMESVAILSHSFINSGGRIIPCRTALVDLGLNDVDPGLAPEGARCADGSLCVNQKCMPVAELKVSPNSCPDNCNGRGICNSKGNCHCDKGYAPPLCLLKGTGGSEDSGPASEPDSTTAVLTFLYVCLVLVPLLLVCSFAIYHRRRILEVSKDGPPEEWKIWMENANPAKKFKRHSDQQDGMRPSRPTSLLTHVDISAPISYDNGRSSTSSPTHALLPHVDTSTSALSAVASDRIQKDGVNSSDNINLKRGMGMKGHGFFGSIAAGLEKSKSRLRTKSMYDGSIKDNTQDSSFSASNRGTKRSFIESLAKSISLPSPKIRGAMKSNANSSTKAHYEITVEHQEPRKDSGDHSPPILSPCDIEEKRSVFTDSINSTQISKNSLSRGTSKESVDLNKKSAFTEVKKVDTTVTVTSSNNLIPGSKSLSSFATSRVNAPYRTTLPASKSYSFRDRMHSNKEAELISNPPTAKSLLEKPEKDYSIKSLEKASVCSEQKININDSIKSSNKHVDNDSQASVPVDNNLQIDTKDRSQYPLTKKFAFPHSSTFSGRSSDNSSKAFLPSSKSCDSASTTQPLHTQTGENDSSSQSDACSLAENTGSNNNKGTNTNGITKEGNVDLVSAKTTQNRTAPLRNIALIKQSIAKKPPTPPKKPNILKTQGTDSVKSPVTTLKNVTDKLTANTTNKVNLGGNNSSNLQSVANETENQTVCKEHDAISNTALNGLSSTSSSSICSSILTAKPNIPTSTPPSNFSLPLSSSSDKQMPLTKTTTVPTLSNIGKSSATLPKSSTLPAVPSSRPLISRPVLQTTTPCAASLIERAPSTGVSQSSILGGTNKTAKLDKSSRGVVFCEPLTLPSPTNPNHPPIIHQQSLTTSYPPTSTQSSVTTVSAAQTGSSQPTDIPIQKSIATVVSDKNREQASTVILPNTTTVDFTPTWKTEPKALPTDAFVCNINDSKGPKAAEKNISPTSHGSNKDVFISSPDSDKSSEKGIGQFSKFKSKLSHVKRTP